ncbi:restriction endonuclease [Bacteroidetes/Chlorobi group bacterium Naka2016]|jgi:hypothetical protein|nr:MAG: restriction endonuclease [Bacteroidetes/Chlorobi group bacterium Naka2016]
MDYQKFCGILNKHIFDRQKKELLINLSNKPERFVGLFRPSKPKTKILQHMLQSQEIRFGDAFEELIEEILKDSGYEILRKSITRSDGKRLSLDHFFKDKEKFYFIEQKIRDDHDSTKKRGQIENFEAKLVELLKSYRNNIIGIMYFIDPKLEKNKNYYKEELKRLEDKYNITLRLCYGKELFEFLEVQDYWDSLLEWLTKWQESLPEIPEINFDTNPENSFNEIKNLEIKVWKNLLTNQELWDIGIINAIFKSGQTLKLLLKFFKSHKAPRYLELSEILEKKLQDYY